MLRLKRGRRSYTFLQKTRRTDLGTLFFLGGLSAAIFAVCAAISFVLQARGGIYLGAAGLVGAVLAVYGFFGSVRHLSRRDGKYLYAAAAAALTGGMTIVWAVLFVLGLHR